MTEGLPLCELEIDFDSKWSKNFDKWSKNFENFVVWNKDQKTLTSIYRFTNQEVGSSDCSLCGAPKAFEDYKGKNLNILTEGDNTYKDIKEAVSAVDDKAWRRIIPHIDVGRARATSDGTFQLCLYTYNFGETPEDQKKDFAKIVMAFRNYFVHPFCDGKKKTPFTEGIAKFFTTAGYGSLGKFEEVINRLSLCFSVILHCVFLESKNARENKGVTKPSQNLFSDPNRKREDYGKIILEYLQKCLAYEETAKEISKALNYIKSILLYSREDAARKTPCGEISGSQSTNIVPTEEQLRCLSEVLTELTWRCEKTVKEAFEKDKRQKNIWALQPICECFMHAFCGGSKGSFGERQNFVELIINLKNSFDPNVNSLFCEQFTDYKNSDVNFKAFSSLTDILSDILHQLLLQEAGLTEFFEKKADA